MSKQQEKETVNFPTPSHADALSPAQRGSYLRCGSLLRSTIRRVRWQQHHQTLCFSASCNVKSLETGQRSQISSLQASRFMTDDNSFQLFLTWWAPKYFSEKWRPNPVNHAHKPSSPLPFALFRKYACIIFILHKLVYIDQQELLNMYLYMLRALQVQGKLRYET